jgi:Alpha/beta hydrolase domain
MIHSGERHHDQIIEKNQDPGAEQRAGAPRSLSSVARANAVGDWNATAASVFPGGAAVDAHDATGATARVRLPPPGQHGFPFMSTILDLAKYGYQEQEFLISGIATAYVPTGPLGDDGRWAVAPNPGVTAPYTVRLLVRRPVDPSRFNGTVVVEWFNETPQFDAAFDPGGLPPGGRPLPDGACREVPGGRVGVTTPGNATRWPAAPALRRSNRWARYAAQQCRTL